MSGAAISVDGLRRLLAGRSALSWAMAATPRRA